MADIKITLEDISALSSRIRNLNNSMENTLNTAKKTMNDLNSYWESESGNLIVSRFNNFSKRFEEEKETIESYAKFLDYTVSTYDSLESTIKSNASTFN